MYLDRGRIEDLKKLESKLRGAVDNRERQKIQGTMDAIKYQADNPRLNKEREKLIEARKRATDAKGEVNINHERREGDKLEERIHKELG